MKNFVAKKQLGQNFLVDPRVKEKIISACDLDQDETVLEIGPGLGALTQAIAPKVKKVIAIETDKNLAQELRTRFQGNNVQIIHADFLKHPVSSLPKELKVIGNLPYYISSPIIEKILLDRKIFRALYITLQNELGDRIIAKRNTNPYSSFSCFVQYYADAQKLFKIKNTAFRPIPKVHSCFLRLSLYKKLPLKAKNEEDLFTVIRQAFQQRRKKIINSLEPLIKKSELTAVLEKLRIDPHLRAENLSLQDYIRLSDQFVLKK